MTGGRLALLAAGEDRLTGLLAPLAAAAVAAGFTVDVIATTDAQRAAANEAGARAIPFAAGGGLNPMTAGDAAGQLASLFRSSRPGLVHAIGLRAAILVGSAAVLGGVAGARPGTRGPNPAARPSPAAGRGSCWKPRTRRGRSASRRPSRPGS